RRPSWRDRASRCSYRSGYPGWCTARAPWRPDRRRPPKRRRAAGARPRAGSSHRASGLVRDLDDQLPEILAVHELDERLGGVLEPVDDVLAVLDLALDDPAREALEAHAEALGEVRDDEALHGGAVHQHEAQAARAGAALVDVVQRHLAADR